MSVSKLVAEEMQRLRRHEAEIERGAAPAAGQRFTSSRVTDQMIVSAVRLPVERSDEVLQDEDGNFLYDPDYSDPLDDDPDIGAPEGDFAFTMGAGGAFDDLEINPTDADFLQDELDRDELDSGPEELP